MFRKYVSEFLKIIRDTYIIVAKLVNNQILFLLAISIVLQFFYINLFLVRIDHEF